MPSDLTPAPGEISALLGPGTHYNGKLLFDGRVRIDGQFQGSICSDDMLIVGEGAQVQAVIDVGTLIVLGGEIRGEIRARELVELHAAARVHGDIETPRIFIDRGAVFEGRCRMSDGTPSTQHPLDGAIAEALEGAQEPPHRDPSRDAGDAPSEDPEATIEEATNHTEDAPDPSEGQAASTTAAVVARPEDAPAK